MNIVLLENSIGSVSLASSGWLGRFIRSWARLAFGVVIIAGMAMNEPAKGQQMPDPPNPPVPAAAVGVLSQMVDEVNRLLDVYDTERSAIVQDAVARLATLNRTQGAEINRVWSDAYRRLTNTGSSRYPELGLFQKFRRDLSNINDLAHRRRKALRLSVPDGAAASRAIDAWTGYYIIVATRKIHQSTDELGNAKRQAELRR